MGRVRAWLPPFDAHHTTSALLFDEYDGQPNAGGDIGADDSNEDEDLNSLMDRGLEEVDDLLNTKGRISGRALRPLEQELTENRHPKLSSSAIDGSENSPSVTTVESPTRTTGGARGQREAEMPTRGVTEKAREICARGTGAHAASVLIPATAPADSADVVSAAAHHPNSHASISTNRALGGSSSETLMNGGDDAAACTDHEVPNVDAEPTRQKEAVQSYHDEARTATGGEANGLHCCSPTRRRAKERTPFIQAKGITLTYAQAKLFGLDSSPYPGASCADRGFRASHGNNYSDTSRRGSGSKRTESNAGGRGSSGISLKGNTRGGRSRRREHHARARTYSPSRMDALAQPIPGRGRVNDVFPAEKAAAWRNPGNYSAAAARKGEKEATFTWKRSRKAEAAMRWATMSFFPDV